VGEHGAVGGAPVVERFAVEVLDQRPAECDVDELQAAAHAEDRDVALEAAGQDGVLELVARLVDHRGRVDRLAPPRGVRVRATGEEQSVESVVEGVVQRHAVERGHEP
jgi:hypothetical protein